MTAKLLNARIDHRQRKMFYFAFEKVELEEKLRLDNISKKTDAQFIAIINVEV